MANIPELRLGERSAEAERVAVLRSESPVRLAALATFAAAIFMAIVQLAAPGRSEGPPAFLSKALGAADSEAPLVQHPEAGVELAIQDSSFRMRSSNATVTLATQGAGAGDWHRFEHGVSRPIAEGAETILVDGPTLEQFLTIRERQGLRTWRWRIDTARVPRVGDDGAVAFLDTKLHRLTDVSIAPAAILDAEGKDVTPNGLRWSVELRNDAWWLTLRLDDSKLPLPYVIDPAVTHRNTQTGTATGATSVSVTKPTGVQANDLLVAHVMVTGNVTASIAGSGWTAVTSATAANAATQASFYKIAGGSEPASYSFTWTGSQAAAATVTAYYGVKSSSPLDLFSAIASTNNTTSVTAATLTTTANDDIVLAFFGSASNSTYTPPGSWNERGDVGTTGISASTADQIKVTAGATGNAVATSTVSARVWGHQAAFKVDNVAPTATMSDPGSPVTGTISLQTSATNDADSYVAQVQFERSPAGAGSWTNVGSADTSSPYSVSFDTTTVADGLYDFRAVATDGAGNTGNSATISNRRIDNTAPSSTTSFPASGGSYNTAGWNAGCGTNGFCGTYSDSGSGVQKVEISIRRNTGNYWNGSSFGSASEVWNTTSLSAGNWSYTFPASSFPANDTYTIGVPRDGQRRASPRRRTAGRSPTTPPLRDTSITANPADPTTSTSASFSFTSTEGSSTFECQLDGGGYSSCTSPKSYAGPLSDGSHTFLVRATDPAGQHGRLGGELHVDGRHDGTVLDGELPQLGRQLQHVGLERRLCDERLLRHVLGRHVSASRRWRSRSARARATTGARARSARAARSGTRPHSRAETGRTPSPPRASRPTAPTRSACKRDGQRRRSLETPSSRSFTIDQGRSGHDDRRRTRRTRRRSDERELLASARPRAARPSSARSTAAATPRARARRATRASRKAATPSSSGPPTSPATPTARPRATRGRSTRWRRARRRASPPPPAPTTPRAGTRAAGRSASAAPTPTRPPAFRRSRSRSARARATTGTPAPRSAAASEVLEHGVARGRQLVVRLPVVELPRGRLLHDPCQGNGQRDECRDAGRAESSLSRRDEPERRSSPSRPRGAAYKNADWNAGCGTNGFCGTYSDATAGVQSVEISIRQGAGNYWNGSSFGSGSEAFQTASLVAGGWSYAFPASSFPVDGSYTVHIRAKDNALNTETGPSRSFTIDNVDPSALFSFPSSGGELQYRRLERRVRARTASVARTPM